MKDLLSENLNLDALVVKKADIEAEMSKKLQQIRNRMKFNLNHTFESKRNGLHTKYFTQPEQEIKKSDIDGTECHTVAERVANLKEKHAIVIKCRKKGNRIKIKRKNLKYTKSKSKRK